MRPLLDLRFFCVWIVDLNAGTPNLHALRSFQVLDEKTPLLEPLPISAMSMNTANPPATYAKTVSRNSRKRIYDNVFPPAPCSVATDSTLVSGASSAFFRELDAILTFQYTF